ncbi:hypothetical protein THASP1DRAFT_29879 [Thamnocephalis sphaerospora]|uniref:Uncharacterized protein n=1 Tax=Thamnocephalis sphaerospora TaxID=78915 RepID=A0A4P9XQJ1_9FUNG|nr:hypothetical protein THASP1DRAFT_29879 [Thamnocephalis sphaerospora]|eukprot:RKP08305.1 hypothetical protein THASP1DRAFT_29879 [Thamnocephalis sphaerospora]
MLFPANEPLDWFRVYCNRRATEYRWRLGLRTEHRPEKATGKRTGGVRLQNIIEINRELQDIRIISQRILAPQQQPVWLSKQLCWDGVDTNKISTKQYQRSDEYLIIVVETRSVFALSTNDTIYAWHLNALHLPPRLITNKVKGPISLYKNWLVIRKHCRDHDTPDATLVFDLAKRAARPEMIEGGADMLHIQQATAGSIRLLWRDEIDAEESLTRISWRFWDYAPDRAPPTQYLSVGRTQLYAGERRLKTCRIDDSRFVIFNQTSVNSADTPPNIKLMEILESNAKVTMVERWSLSQELNSTTPIVSQDMLLVTLRSMKHRLLNLSDGSPVHDISITTLDCWTTLAGSGEYPWSSDAMYTG